MGRRIGRACLYLGNEYVGEKFHLYNLHSKWGVDIPFDTTLFSAMITTK